jgi:O-antigen ligase/tetratricopeptide (TPR) repeat protein
MNERAVIAHNVGGRSVTKASDLLSQKPEYSRTLELLRVCCALILLLHSVGYASALWAWICVAVSWITLSESKPSDIRLTSIDYAVIAVWLFEVASIPLSSFPSNGWIYAEQLTVAIAFYFCISRLRSTFGLLLVALFVCGLTFVLAVPDAMHFVDRYSEWTQLRFGSIADVRQTLTVVDPNPAGAHYTSYLFFLAWGLATTVAIPRAPFWARCVGALAACAGLTGILLGLSRGLCLGLVAGACFAYGTLRFRPEEKCRFRIRAVTITAVLVLLGVGLLLRLSRQPSPKESFAVDSESADRSIQGRLFIWQQSLRRGKTRPFLGFGARTFVLYGGEGITQDSGDAVDRAFSFPVQVLFERGLVGIFIYAGLFVVVFRTGLANIRQTITRDGRSFRSMSWSAAAGLTAILVRDLTYTTLFDDKAVTVGAFGLIGLIALEECKRTRTRTTWNQNHESLLLLSKPAIFGAVIVLGLIVGAHRVRRAAAEWYAAQAVREGSMHDDRGALRHSLRALSILPTPYLQAQAGFFSARSAGIVLGDHGRPGLSGTDQAGLRQLADAESFYKVSLDAFPSEAAWQHNLGWLLWLRGDRPSALQRIRHAVDLEPATAVYRQSLILMLIDESAIGSARDELVTLLTFAPEVMDSPWWENIALEQRDMVQVALHRAIEVLGSGSAPRPIQLAREARLYLEAGDSSLAELLLEKSLQELPGMSGAWRTQALILARQGQWDGATEALERAVFLNPWDSAGYYALSRVVLHLSPGIGEDPRALKRVSFMFKTKAVRVQAISRRSPESLRAYRKLQIETPVLDDLVVDGMLEFCMPGMTQEYDKLVQ